METWREDALPGHTHDPNEVTVQIDGLGRTLADLATGAGAGGAVEGPVFVDETGRRGRRYRRIGVIIGVACAVYALVIVGTLFSGSSHAPWLPVQAPEGGKPGKGDGPAGTADASGRPYDRVEPADSTDSADPDDPADPSASAGAGAPSRGAVDGTEAVARPGGSGDSRRGDEGGSPAAAPAAADGKPGPGSGPVDGGGGPGPAPTGGAAEPGSGPTAPAARPPAPPAQPTVPGDGDVPADFTPPAAQQPPADPRSSSSGDAQR
ncbi:hypothetical protein [Streptomyces alboniger]|uniref:hypothetical protein n=2 Tax=Streptomyces alboniger TaxID=132473 RepID=UPI00123D4A7D|nr:hypothetical protein [Streptomyces alboniger]